jgi:hypothetical protein
MNGILLLFKLYCALLCLSDDVRLSLTVCYDRVLNSQVCLQDDASGEMVCFVPGQGPPQLEQKLHAE